MMALEEQSPNIASGVHLGRAGDDVGAGDQVTSRHVMCSTSPRTAPHRALQLAVSSGSCTQHGSAASVTVVVGDG